MSTIVVVGAQWGDEGKGKVVDVLAEEAEIVARYAGGNNAGHTLLVDDKQIITHLVPSGCRYPGTVCALGSGMVIDIDVLREEVELLAGHGLLQGGELRVSLDAHLVLPYHRLLDGLREDQGGAENPRLGTTRRGIGPAYESKAGRRGIRVRDLQRPERLRDLLLENKAHCDGEARRLDATAPLVDVDAIMRQADKWAQWLLPHVCDVGSLIDGAVKAGKRVLFEGAQGAMLDLDHGTYPFVTSSSTIAGGVCTGIGIGPTAIDRVWGITKAYATRVGAGPFPTKLEGTEGERLRELGSEFGATTGRPRDCGWLDLPALRHAARINGMTGLCITKLDVLVRMPGAKLCVAYRDGREPGIDELSAVEPVLEAIPGWGEPEHAEALRKARSLSDLPSPIRRYLDRVADAIGVPIVLISTGADRKQTIMVDRAFP